MSGVEEEEGVRVLGVGVGLFLLMLVWSSTAAGLVLVSRDKIIK